MKTCPIPVFSGLNIIHIKAFQDNLTERDLIQYIGELYVVLFWFSKMYPDLYKEIYSMATSEEEMATSMFPHVLEQWREKGIEKGIENILDILKARFGEVSREVMEKVENLRDLDYLARLVRLSATCESLDEFEAGI